MKYLIAVFTLLYSGMVSAQILTIVMEPNPKETECEQQRVSEGEVCSMVAVVIVEPDDVYDAVCIMNQAGGRLCYILRPGHMVEHGATKIFPADVHIIEGKMPQGAKF